MNKVKRASLQQDFSESLMCSQACESPKGPVVSSSFQIVELFLTEPCARLELHRSHSGKCDLVCSGTHAFGILAWIGGRSRPMHDYLLSPFARKDIFKPCLHGTVFTVEQGSPICVFPQSIANHTLQAKIFIEPCPELYTTWEDVQVMKLIRGCR